MLYCFFRFDPTCQVPVLSEYLDCVPLMLWPKLKVGRVVWQLGNRGFNAVAKLKVGLCYVVTHKEF